MLRISNRLLALLRLCLHVLTAIRMTMGGFVARYEARHGGLALRLMGAGELTTDTHGSPLNWLSPVVPRSCFCAFCAFCGLLASCLLPLASCLSPLASRLSPLASCLLPLASCLLPLAEVVPLLCLLCLLWPSRLLPLASRLLPKGVGRGGPPTTTDEQIQRDALFGRLCRWRGASPRTLRR